MAGEPTDSIHRNKLADVFRPTVQPESRSLLTRFGFTVGAVLVGWLARTALTPAVGQTGLPFIFFFPAVAAAAWFGGLWPAILSMVLTMLAARWFFMDPVHTLSLNNVADIAALSAFVLGCLFILSLIHI